jgi:hypothetical protein
MSTSTSPAELIALVSAFEKLANAAMKPPEDGSIIHPALLNDKFGGAMFDDEDLDRLAAQPQKICREFSDHQDYINVPPELLRNYGRVFVEMISLLNAKYVCQYHLVFSPPS